MIPLLNLFHLLSPQEATGALLSEAGRSLGLVFLQNVETREQGEEQGGKGVGNQKQSAREWLECET